MSETDQPDGEDQTEEPNLLTLTLSTFSNLF